MRVEAFEVSNFKGLRHAQVERLGSLPLITVSGPNGSGKSLLLEAITIAWRGEVGPRPHESVGPWSPNSTLQLTLALAPQEWVEMEVFGNEHGITVEPFSDGMITFQAELQGAGGWTSQQHPQGASQVLRNAPFRRSSRFAAVDFLPADRTIQRGESARIDAGMLGDQQQEEFRQQVFNAFLQNRQIVQLAGVQSYLSSLDYLELVAE